MWKENTANPEKDAMTEGKKWENAQHKTRRKSYRGKSKLGGRWTIGDFTHNWKK